MASRTIRADVIASVAQSRTPPPSSRALLSAGPSPSCSNKRGEKRAAQGATEQEGDDEEKGALSDSSEWDSDDSDQFEDLNGDGDDDDDKNIQKHHHQPPLHIPDIPWRPDLLPPSGIFPLSHFLTDENWELWHNNWLSILLANGVPTATTTSSGATSSSSSNNASSSTNRFLLSIRDDYLLGAYMRMTMTPEVLRGNPRCENQLVEFVSARELWRWLPITLGDFSSAGGGGANKEGGGGGGTIRIVRADQPWRIRGRRWTRFGRVVDVEALKEGERYDR